MAALVQASQEEVRASSGLLAAHSGAAMMPAHPRLLETLLVSFKLGLKPATFLVSLFARLSGPLLRLLAAAGQRAENAVQRLDDAALAPRGIFLRIYKFQLRVFK